ncbi:hypothetical protein B0H10DRAFT_2073428 [Mycena sp. CBHHK59/15]|nr:hypothetical protein B0H10DRAFT_2073428 [Mycena sp. CBHHK59/15]
MLCLASAVVLVLHLLSAAPHPCHRCPASVSLVLRVMATFCPSPPPSTLCCFSRMWHFPCCALSHTFCHMWLLLQQTKFHHLYDRLVVSSVLCGNKQCLGHLA